MTENDRLTINVTGNADDKAVRNALADARYHQTQKWLQGDRDARTISIAATGMDAGLFARLTTIITEEWPGTTLTARSGTLNFRIPDESSLTGATESDLPIADHQDERPPFVPQTQEEPPRAVNRIRDRYGNFWWRGPVDNHVWVCAESPNTVDMFRAKGTRWGDMGAAGPFTWEQRR